MKPFEARRKIIEFLEPIASLLLFLLKFNLTKATVAQSAEQRFRKP